jgi:hypothetical protein
MKNLIFFYGLLLLLGCKKKHERPTYGQISAFYVNGKSLPRDGYELSVLASQTGTKNCSTPHYAISSNHNAKNGFLQEQIYISGLPHNKIGKIPLTYRPPHNSCDSIPTAVFLMSEVDLTIGEYVLLRSADSFINIESYNTQTKEVKGTFDVTFVENGTSTVSRGIYPDTIRFDRAKFSAIIN